MFQRVVFCEVEAQPDVDAYAAEWDAPFDAEAYKQMTGGTRGPGVTVKCSGCNAKVSIMGQSERSIRAGLNWVGRTCACGHSESSIFYTTGDGSDGWAVWSATDRAHGTKILP